MTLTRLEKTLDYSDSTLTRRACDSDSTKMTYAHHWVAGDALAATDSKARVIPHEKRSSGVLCNNLLKLSYAPLLFSASIHFHLPR